MVLIVGLLAIAPSGLADVREDRTHWFVSTYGGFSLDLQRALFPDQGPVTINIVSVFGRPRIRVPVGVGVDFGGFVLVGRRRARGAPSKDNSRAWVKVNRTSLVGGVLVETVSRAGVVG
jgi:hypothetical protein